MSPSPRCGWSWADLWLVLVLAAPIWIAPGNPSQTLAAAYAVKSLVVLILILPWLALAPRTQRLPRSALAVMAVVGAFTVSALVHRQTDSVELIDALLRVALPLMAVAIARSTTAARTIVAGIVGLAGVLAVLAIIESLSVELASEAQARPAVLLLHRNNVAFHLCTALPLCLAALMQVRTRGARLALAVVSIAVLAAIVVARSRGAWLAACAGTLPLLLVVPRVMAIRVASVAAALAIALGAWSAHAGLEPLSDRVRGAFDPVGEAAWFERLAIYKHTLSRIAEHPLAGWGAGAFATRHTRFLDGRPADHPHNDLLTAGYEAGIGGALALATVLVLVTGGLVRRARRTRQAVVAGLAGSMLAWCVAGAINSPLSLSPSAVSFWLTVGAALSLPRTEDT